MISRFNKILQRANKNDVGILYELAIVDIKEADTREKAELALVSIAPFFITSLYSKLDEEDRKNLFRLVEGLEYRFGDLSKMMKTIEVNLEVAKKDFIKDKRKELNGG